MAIDELIAIIYDAKTQFGIEGVTFLGGEPTLQKGLAQLAQAIQYANLGVILFTGNQVEELSDELRTSVDLIIDGGFEQEKRETIRNLIGSTNQRIFFTTDRYRSHEKWFYISRPKRVEINISDGLFITGDKV